METLLAPHLAPASEFLALVPEFIFSDARILIFGARILAATGNAVPEILAPVPEFWHQWKPRFREIILEDVQAIEVLTEN